MVYEVMCCAILYNISTDATKSTYTALGMALMSLSVSQKLFPVNKSKRDIVMIYVPYLLLRLYGMYKDGRG